MLQPHTLVTRPTTLSTWWTILRICLAERLVYRGDFMLGTFMRFLPIVTQIFLWGAIFSAISDSHIAGYTQQDFIAYYLLTMVSRAFSSMPGLASGIAGQIRKGEIKKFLIQPIDLIGFLFSQRVAHKLVYYTVATIPFAVVFWICRGYFPGWPDAVTLAAFAASLVMSFLLGFFLEATIGMIGFWFLEVGSLLFVYMLFSFFCSGHMFPLDMLPGVWRQIVYLLPLKYLAYFPAAVFLGKVTGVELARGLALQLAWVLFFMFTCRLAFQRGLRRYSTTRLNMSEHPSYLRVFGTFARNSLVRDMSFRSNFVIDFVSSLTWMLMNLGFYLLIFSYTDYIGAHRDWNQHQFFVFLSTTLFINSLVQAFFMPNAEEFSELIRTGQLDFALLKPIDTQFLISLGRIEFSSLGNFLFAAVLMSYSLWQLHSRGDLNLSWPLALLYPIYVLCGVGILYSLMIGLAATSIWLGRNQSLYDFWFYITNFSRYPMEIYSGRWGTPLRQFFTFIVPVLIVVNIPARLLAWPLESQNWPLACFAVFATLASLLVSRWIFNRALYSYRSASS